MLDAFSSTTDGVVLLGCVSVTGVVVTSECATEDSTASEVATLVAVSLATVRDAVLVSGVAVAVATAGAVFCNLIGFYLSGTKNAKVPTSADVAPTGNLTDAITHLFALCLLWCYCI
ncbi:MAG: hypothetical protein ACLS3V_03770 [Streptococcus sp.]